MAIRFWLAVVQREHVLRGVALGIAQVNHGAKAPLARMGESDGLVYYSPRTSYPDGEPLKEFTAIGRIADDQVFQDAQASMQRTPAADSYATGGRVDDFRPWRRRVDYDADAVSAPIRPLLPVLEFTRENPNWGYQLRRGLIELSRHDFDVIRAQMRRPSPDDPGARWATISR
jgi:hypothetical protein